MATHSRGGFLALVVVYLIVTLRSKYKMIGLSVALFGALLFIIFIPVISFDCPSGPGVILHHGEDGLLVPPGDVDGLADAMSRLMANDQERRRLGKNALAVHERFSKEKIMGEWEKLIGTLVAD